MKILTIDAQVRMAHMLANAGWYLTPPPNLTNRGISVETPLKGAPIIGTVSRPTKQKAATDPAEAPEKTVRLTPDTDKATLLRAYARRPRQYLSDVQAAASVNLHKTSYGTRCAELRRLGLIEVKEGSTPKRCKITAKGQEALSALAKKPDPIVRKRAIKPTKD